MNFSLNKVYFIREKRNATRYRYIEKRRLNKGFMHVVKREDISF